MDDRQTPPDDLLDSSCLRPLWRLLGDMDRDIASLYDEAGITGVRTRFVGPLITLGRHGPMTIQALATAIEVSHSAMSQTAAAMRKAGLVDPAEDDAETADRRTRRIQLSDAGRELLPFLEAEWRATEATVRALDAEIPYPISRVVEDIHAALRHRSFRQRLTDNLSKARQGKLK